MSSTLALPSAEEEIWRYSRIGELDMSQFTPGTVRTVVSRGDAFASARSRAGIAMKTPADVFAEMNLASGVETTFVLP